MDANDLNEHLSQIETHWSRVFEAHRGSPNQASDALAALVQRYGGAIHRYLLASLHDVDAADDLAQEFALRFLRGDFRNAHPGKGRFRDFLKRAVYHLMVDYYRAHRARPQHLNADDAESSPQHCEPWATNLDREFVSSWRDLLLARAWTALDRIQDRTGQPFADVLRLRVDYPEHRSAQLAEQLTERWGILVKAGWVRLNLHRARDIFTRSLIDEVKQSLRACECDDLEEELSELGLLDYCRSALGRRGSSGSA